MPALNDEQKKVLFNFSEYKNRFELSETTQQQVLDIIERQSQDDIDLMLKFSGKSRHHRKAILCNIRDGKIEELLQSLHDLNAAEQGIAKKPKGNALLDGDEMSASHHQSRQLGGTLVTIDSASASGSEEASRSNSKEHNINTGVLDNVSMDPLVTRACPHFKWIKITEHARKSMALKLRANFSNLVAMLRKCLSLAKRFSTKCLSLYKYASNSGFGFLLFDLRGITGIMPYSLAFVRISSES